MARQTVITITLDHDAGIGNPDKQDLVWMLRDALGEYATNRGAYPEQTNPEAIATGIRDYIVARYGDQSEVFRHDKFSRLLRLTKMARDLRCVAGVDIVVRLSGDED